jgi:rhamnosyltransferase
MPEKQRNRTSNTTEKKNNKQCTVAVLLAAYDGMCWLPEQLESIFQQRDVMVQIFISVDVSNDGTYEWCKEQETFHENVTVLSYGERYGGAAKNFFRLIRDVDWSSFDYVSLADQDDIWLENKLNHAVSLMDKTESEAFSSDVMAFWQSGREVLVKKSYPQKEYDFYFEAAGPGCSYVFSQSSLAKFKTFLIANWNEVNQVSLHDWLLYAFFRSRNMKWHIDSQPLMRYRQHESNQVGMNSGFKAAFKRLSLIRNGWYFDEVNKISSLVNRDIQTDFSLSKAFLFRNILQLRRRPRDLLALIALLLVVKSG